LIPLRHNNYVLKQVSQKKFLRTALSQRSEYALDIVEAMSGFGGFNTVLELAGMGVLTKYLLEQGKFDHPCSEIDRESVAYLKKFSNRWEGKIVEGDF